MRKMNDKEFNNAIEHTIATLIKSLDSIPKK